MFTVLERCQPGEVTAREQFWIDHYQSANERHGYNLSPTAGSSLGTRMSAEQKERYRESNKKKMTAEARSRLSVMMRGNKRNKSWDPEVRARIAATLTGRKQSEETVAKRVVSLRGKRRSTEARARMSAAALANRENRRKAANIRWHGSH